MTTFDLAWLWTERRAFFTLQEMGTTYQRTAEATILFLSCQLQHQIKEEFTAGKAVHAGGIRYPIRTFLWPATDIDTDPLKQTEHSLRPSGEAQTRTGGVGTYWAYRGQF